MRKRLNDIAYKDCVGKICKSNNCGDFKIIDAVNSAKVEVRFINTGYQTVYELGNIRKGHVKDLFAPTVFGVGVLGDKCNVSCLENGKRVRCLEYQLWLGMLHRCYSEDLHSVHPTYKDCVVSDGFVVVHVELSESIAEKLALEKVEKPRQENDVVWQEIADRSYKDHLIQKKWEIIRNYKELVEAVRGGNE